MDEEEPIIGKLILQGKQNKQTKEQRVKQAKQRFLDEFGSICFYCEIPLDIISMTRDHVVPKSKGGKTERGNLVPSCANCNQEKGDMDAEEFKKGKKKCPLRGYIARGTAYPFEYGEE